jgi:hypothetical protein
MTKRECNISEHLKLHIVHIVGNYVLVSSPITTPLSEKHYVLYGRKQEKLLNSFRAREVETAVIKCCQSGRRESLSRTGSLQGKDRDGATTTKNDGGMWLAPRPALKSGIGAGNSPLGYGNFNNFPQGIRACI